MIRFRDLPLRQRKQAQTRLALMNATLDRLDGDRSLDAISVKELCDAVSVSEASFFNYFPRKADVLVYFVQLWSLDLARRARHELAEIPARAAIAAIFAATARQVAARPAVMAEILAQQARWTGPPRLLEVSLAERLLAYPDRPGIEDVPAMGLDGLLPPLIARGVEGGALPSTLDPRAAFLALSSVFFGVPLVLGRRDPAAVEAAYQQQLDVVWTGLQHAPPAAGVAPAPPQQLDLVWAGSPDVAPTRPPRARAPRGARP